MAKKKKFSEPGETEQRIRWNKAKTRKWLTEYTVMEVHPPKERKRNVKEKNTLNKKLSTKGKSSGKRKKSSKRNQSARSKKS